jgi:hypothetical protein
MERIFTKDEVDALLKKAISGTIKGIHEWMKSDDVFITDTDTGKLVDRNCEIDSTPNSVQQYVNEGLKQKGINIVFSEL